MIRNSFKVSVTQECNASELRFTWNPSQEDGGGHFYRALGDLKFSPVFGVGGLAKCGVFSLFFSGRGGRKSLLILFAYSMLSTTFLLKIFFFKVVSYDIICIDL